jgi:uncharacterized protein GlcG (DUF336 family)
LFSECSLHAAGLDIVQSGLVILGIVLGSVILFMATMMRHAVNLDYNDAKQALDLIIDKTQQMQKAVAVAITDSHGELIAFARMDEVPLPSIAIAMNKACKRVQRHGTRRFARFAARKVCETGIVPQSR